MPTWGWIPIGIAILVVLVVIVAAIIARQRRTAALRDRFGDEYERTVGAAPGRRSGEAQLRSREQERSGLSIRSLPEASRLRFAEEWREIQTRFVDQPAQAVSAADTLVTRVMEQRGYPVADFDKRSDLISVDHPGLVENYRYAHGVNERNLAQRATTEELRDAFLRYRSLFDELLRPDAGETGVGAGAGTGQAVAGIGPDGAGPAGVSPDGASPSASAPTGYAADPGAVGTSAVAQDRAAMDDPRSAEPAPDQPLGPARRADQP